MWQDDQETANTQQSTFEYGGKQIVSDVRNLPTNTESQIPLQKSMVGNLFYGAEGFMIVHPTGYQVFRGDDHEEVIDQPRQEERVWTPVPHMANFLDAVRHRDHTKLHADIADGVAAAALCHYGNAALRVGRVVRPDPLSGRLLGDAEANALVERPGREPYQIPRLAQ